MSTQQLITLDDVRTVLAIAEHGTFLTAAKHLGKSQSVVSRVVTNLEHTLGPGARLIRRQRGRTRSVLTPLGRAFVDEMKRLQLEWQGAEHRLQASASTPDVGEVRLGVYAAVVHLLPPIVKRFKSDHPKVRLTLSAQTLQQTLDTLRSGDIDLAIRPAPSKVSAKHFRITRLAPVPRVVILPKGHRLENVQTASISDLAQERWILPGKGVPVRAFVEQQVPSVNVTIECLDLMLTKRLVTESVGISVVPDLCLEDHDRRDLVAIHMAGLSHESYAILTTRRGPHSKASQKFLDLLKKEWERNSGNRQASQGRG